MIMAQDSKRKGKDNVKVLIVNQAEVVQLLPMDECIEAMARTLKTLARGGAILPLRPTMPLPEGLGVLAMMPSFLSDPGAIGLKAITVFHKNHGTIYDSHQGAVLLFEPEHGSLRAVVDASEVTAIRTAAVSGVATRLLAREDAGVLALIGSGTQARTHLEAMLAVRPIRHVRVWSRDPAHARDFAERESRRHNIAVEPAESAERAVEGADIICTVTSSTEPVLMGGWLAPGMHINAIGSSRATARELDATAIARSRLYVDRRESTLNEAGDFLYAKREGAVGDGHILAEIGEILIGEAGGRSSPEQITLFKSLGLAIEDTAAAHHIYTKATEKQMGTWVEFTGLREEDFGNK